MIRLHPMNVFALRNQCRNLYIVVSGMMTMELLLIIFGGLDSTYVGKSVLHNRRTQFGYEPEDKSNARNKPTIQCILLTHESNYDVKAIHVQNTWARRCTKFSFISKTRHPKLKLLNYNQTKPDAYGNLWAKMMDAYKALYREADQYDYVFKADDDTYAIYENLEALVGKFSPEDLIQTGRLMRDRTSPQFFSGGSGYVLSRASLKEFVSRGILTHDRPPQCNSRNGPEDTRLADCARAIGVAQLNCLEHNRTELFFNREPEYLVSGRRLHFDRLNKGQLDWSRHTRHLISVHYTGAQMQYIMEFLIYYIGLILNQEILRSPNSEFQAPNYTCTRQYPKR
ncbi:Glycoprotein-N-acetylgalactosamine 3-beta-galactosyltransferase [Fasciola hepatica]|uniref:Glycoprotein-N-acetylgalactosamine 3-beta-galactosyltransferase n=1 Tax=Fasciola hepatica TaxID=6192 RepID=A0A4E0R5D5_FASHE|nr:Glycoprotein-N-acetylgalactosamine 3-beta-galactosyltransferase [Fasciola hepatica]